jgi:hypothetical protein
VRFGSGYVVLAFLRSDLVERLHWMTESQLLDAVAVGQITPGPVFTTATFVGYLLGGGGGAAVATLGIFLPAFVFVAISGPLVPRIRRSPVAGAVLDGVNVASLALMAAVTLQLGRAAIVVSTEPSIATPSGAHGCPTRIGEHHQLSLYLARRPSIAPPAIVSSPPRLTERRWIAGEEPRRSTTAEEEAVPAPGLVVPLASPSLDGLSLPGHRCDVALSVAGIR